MYLVACALKQVHAAANNRSKFFFIKRFLVIKKVFVQSVDCYVNKMCLTYLYVIQMPECSEWTCICSERQVCACGLQTCIANKRHPFGCLFLWPIANLRLRCAKTRRLYWYIHLPQPLRRIACAYVPIGARMRRSTKIFFRSCCSGSTSSWKSGAR